MDNSLTFYKSKSNGFIYYGDQADIDDEQIDNTSILLEAAKKIKINENNVIRDKALISGFMYKNIHFDSDDSQLINIIGTASILDDKQTIEWCGFDGISTLTCTKEDLLILGGLIQKLRSTIWATINPYYLDVINNAKTIDEVNAITIDRYNNIDIGDNNA